MSRYIDADGLLAKVPQASADIFENCRNCTCLDSEQIKELINAEPTADVAEVKHGRWVKGIGENGVTSACFCSECHFEDNRYSLFNYCPKCGSRMIDEVEE